MKNLILLGLFTFITLAYAKEPIESESLADAEAFKVEKAVKEKSADRRHSRFYKNHPCRSTKCDENFYRRKRYRRSFHP